MASHSPKKIEIFVITVCDTKYAVHHLICLYIFQVQVTVYALKNIKLEYEAHMNMTNMQKYAPQLC